MAKYIDIMSVCENMWPKISIWWWYFSIPLRWWENVGKWCQNMARNTIGDKLMTPFPPSWSTCLIPKKTGSLLASRGSMPIRWLIITLQLDRPWILDRGPFENYRILENNLHKSSFPGQRWSCFRWRWNKWRVRFWRRWLWRLIQSTTTFFKINSQNYIYWGFSNQWKQGIPIRRDILMPTYFIKWPSKGPQLEVIACGGVTINADGSFDIVASCFGNSGLIKDYNWKVNLLWDFSSFKSIIFLLKVWMAPQMTLGLSAPHCWGLLWGWRQVENVFFGGILVAYVVLGLLSKSKWIRNPD